MDGTKDTGDYGRLINHSKLNPNLEPRAMTVEDRPCLVLFALKDIAEGRELQYEYGDRSKKAVAANP